MNTHGMLGALSALALASAMLCGPAHASNPKDILKCQQTIAKETSKFVGAKTKILQKCEESIVKGKFAGPCPDSKSADKIAALTGKLEAGIAKKCCGKDKICGNADDCTLGELGIGDPSCPNVEGGNAPTSACQDLVLQDAGDIAPCVACVAEEHVDEIIALYYGDLAASDPKLEKGLNKCQQEIGKAAAKFLVARSKELVKCADAILKGKFAGPCPDAKAAEKIQKAEDAKVAAICKKCGGADKTCDGVDDFTSAEIGAPAVCPGMIEGQAPGGDIDTLQDLIDCVDQSTARRTDCTDALGAPATTTAPPDCRRDPESCTPDSTTTDVQITFGSPVDLLGIKVAISYPEDRTTIPGSLGDDPLTLARVSNQQSNTSLSTNDLGDTLQIALSGFDTAFTAPDLVQVEFDDCGGAVSSADFACIVLEASDENQEVVAGVTCAANVLP